MLVEKYNSSMGPEDGSAKIFDSSQSNLYQLNILNFLFLFISIYD
jgi:hypothetical protein